MENNIKTLIERLRQSDLSDEDKIFLIEKLNRSEPDIQGFSNAFMAVLRVSKEVLKLFDIDILDDFDL
jgi:hypothetical protein